MDIQCIYEEGGLTLLTDIQMLKKIKLHCSVNYNLYVSVEHCILNLFEKKRS